MNSGGWEWGVGSGEWLTIPTVDVTAPERGPSLVTVHYPLHFALGTSHLVLQVSNYVVGFGATNFGTTVFLIGPYACPKPI